MSKMAPEFPLVRSFHTLVWNIRHYQPLHKRPPFRATRHPFCTNIQLQNASCAFWLKETSRDIRTKLSKQLEAPAPTRKSQREPVSFKLLSISPSALYGSGAQTSSQDDTQMDESAIHPAEVQVVALFKAGDFGGLYKQLCDFKEQGTVLSKEIINEMISSVNADLPIDSTHEYLYQSVVEVPYFFGKDVLRYATLYGRVYPLIEHLYNICKLYEPEYGQDKKFIENHIWLSYHMNDLSLLQLLLFTYLKEADYDSRTLSCVVNAFVYNYDVEFSLSLFRSIVDMKKPLDESFLSSTLVAYTKVDALFDKSLDLLQCWINSTNCETPYPKTVAFLLKQHYRFGNESEIGHMEKLTEQYGYNVNFLVQMVKNQATISNRSFDRKKAITAEDVKEILKIRNSVSHSKYALKIFYESYLHFFSNFSSMHFLQLILREMKKDELPFTKFSYDTIVQHYVLENKFLPLLKFILKFVSKANRFELIYVKYIFDCFVNTYPYQAEEFGEKFSAWVENLDILEANKRAILDSCKLRKLNSAITPVAVQKRGIENSKKYGESQWKTIYHQPHKFLKKSQTKDQIQFRMNNGIRDVIRRGIRPDYSIIENTLRNLNASHRASLMKILPDIRMDKYKTRLEIFDFLQSQPTKSKLESFVTAIEPRLNTSDKLLLARRLFNENSFDLAIKLLDTLNKDEINDSRHILRLNLCLRVNMARNDYDACIKDIDDFPLDDITLSPYIYKQCQYIEKNLMRKIRALESNEESPLHGQVDLMKAALAKLKGLLGDIGVRLERDKTDIQKMIKQVFELLDGWIESTKNHDERKI